MGGGIPPSSKESRKKQSINLKEFYKTKKGIINKQIRSRRQKENNISPPSRKGIYYSKEMILKKSKTWKIINPSKEKLIITNLKKFCKDNNLHAGHIAGKSGYKGWKAELYNPMN